MYIECNSEKLELPKKDINKYLLKVAEQLN